MAGVDRAATSMLRYDVASGSRRPGGSPARARRSSPTATRRRTASALGDRLTLRSATGGSVTAQVSAITRQPAIDVLGVGDVTLPWDAYRSAFGTKLARFGLVDTAGGASPAQRAAIAGRCARSPAPTCRPPSAGAQDQAVVARPGARDHRRDARAGRPRQPARHRQHARAVVVERTREIGLLRAAGMTRRQVRRMVRWESVLTALVGAGLGHRGRAGLAARRHRAARRPGPGVRRCRPGSSRRSRSWRSPRVSSRR